MARSRNFCICFELFPKQGDLGGRLLELGMEPPTTGCVATGKRQDDAGQRDGVQDPGLNVARPLPGQAYRWANCHGGLRMNCGKPNRNSRRFRQLGVVADVLRSLADYSPREEGELDAEPLRLRSSAVLVLALAAAQDGQRIFECGENGPILGAIGRLLALDDALQRQHGNRRLTNLQLDRPPRLLRE